MFKTLIARLKSFENGLGKRWGHDISTPQARRRAYWHFHFLDHGVLRRFWTNMAEIAPGVWRSNQPSPARLRKLKKAGFHTVFNLRGANPNSPYLFEKETCDEIDLILISHSLTARSMVEPAILLTLLDKFETIERPFVMHCKSGADRAGLASALYLLHILGRPIAEAKKQLSFRFLHLKSFQTGILDHILEAYEADTRTQPMAIREWIETRYNPHELTLEFNAERGRS